MEGAKAFKHKQTCNVSSCTTLTVCHRLLLRSCCEANHFSDSGEGSEEKNCNVTGKTVSAVVCVSWHC